MNIFVNLGDANPLQLRRVCLVPAFPSPWQVISSRNEYESKATALLLLLIHSSFSLLLCTSAAEALHGGSDAAMSSVSIRNDGVPQAPEISVIPTVVKKAVSGIFTIMIRLCGQNFPAKLIQIQTCPIPQAPHWPHPQRSAAQHQIVHRSRLGAVLRRHAAPLLVLLAVVEELGAEELIHLVVPGGSWDHRCPSGGTFGLYHSSDGTPMAKVDISSSFRWANR